MALHDREVDIFVLFVPSHAKYYSIQGFLAEVSREQGVPAGTRRATTGQPSTAKAKRFPK